MPDRETKTILERLVDAVTMMFVSSLCLALLLFVAHGTILRTYEQLIVEKLFAQGQLVQSAMENYIRPGLPLRQYVGFQQLTEPMVKQDPMLDRMAAYDYQGERVFSAGEATIRPIPPTDERQIANNMATVRNGDRHVQVVLPLRNKFERVGDLILSVNRHRIPDKVNAEFKLVFLAAGVAILLFGFIVFTSWDKEAGSRRRRVAVGFTGTYLLVAAAVALTMVSVFTDGVQSKGRALADSLGQRLDDVVNFGIQLDQVDGIDEVLNEYRRLNPEISATGVTLTGRVIVHTDPTKIGRYWATDPANHEYRSDLTPPNHPRPATVVVAVPKAVVYWQVLRSVKNFAALFVASSFFAFLFMQVAQAIEHARRTHGPNVELWREGAALDLVKPIFFLAVFVDHLAYAFLPQFVSDIVQREGLTSDAVAIPFTAYYLCFALALMPAGRYELRFGSRALILTGLIMTAVSLVAMAISPTYNAVVIARGASGVGQGMLFIGIQSFVLLKSSRENKTRANTIIVFGYQAGMISGMAIGSLLVGQISPNGVFALGAMIALAATLYSQVVLPGPDARGAPQPLVASARDIWTEIGWMLRDGKFLRTILFVGVPAKAVLTGAVLFAMPLMLHARGFPQEDIGQIIMIYAACVIFSSTWAARLADHTANTRVILVWGTVLTAAGLFTIASYGWEPIATLPQASTLATVLTVIGIAMVGIAHGFINAPVVTHVTETEVARRFGSGQVGAGYRFLERAGHTLGPIFMGQLFTHFGIGHAAFAFAGLIVLLLGLIFLITSRAEAAHNSTPQEFAR
jgi:predicted MFS family arabinose efflux permease